MEKSSKIFVAGADTFIGGAILHMLEKAGYREIVGRPGEAPNLTIQGEVESFFAEEKPEYVFMAGGKIAGIGANQIITADLMLDNLLVTTNVIQNAHRHGTKKLLYLGSSCSYPKLCPQPMNPESLLSGPPEVTSEYYSLAKIAGMKLCQAFRKQYGSHFISAIPANPFGPGDDFDPKDAHVIGALINKMHTAKKERTPFIEIWGTGSPRREFIFIEDLADACLFVMKNYNEPEPINLGGGSIYTIRELASMIREVVGYSGEMKFDTSKPDGMPSKCLDSNRLQKMGWKAQTSFEVALGKTYNDFKNGIDLPIARCY